MLGSIRYSFCPLLLKFDLPVADRTGGLMSEANQDRVVNDLHYNNSFP